MSKFTKYFFSILLSVALVVSAFAFNGSFAEDKPVFSLNRVSETEKQVVVSINLESGTINNYNFEIKTSSNISKCTSISNGSVLREYVVNEEGIATANNPANRKVTMASTVAMSKTGEYVVFTFTKANTNRVSASDFTVVENDIEGGCVIENKVPSKFSSASLTCTTSGSEATIVKCKTDAFGRAAIPSVINGKTVVAIADGAFSGCNELDGVTVPNSVTKIGKKAFENCKGVKSVTFGKSVKSIGEDAFIGCSGIETAVFTGMLEDWCSIDFANANSNLNTVAKNLTINGKVISGDVVFSNDITSIGKNAFLNFKDITSVTLGEKIASVGEGAFNGCTGITTVIIPEGTKTIANDAFAGCTKLAKVGYKSSAENWKKISIGSGNDSLKNAEIEYYYGHVHVYKAVNVVKPTCTTGGYTEYKCTMCDAGYTGDETKATGHSSATWKYDKDKHWKVCDADKVTFDSAKHTFDANGGCKCGYITAKMGDLNNDSKINSVDALILLQFVVGQVTPNATQKVLADTNNDGKYDSTDALRVLQYTVGIIKSF